MMKYFSTYVIMLTWRINMHKDLENIKFQIQAMVSVFEDAQWRTDVYTYIELVKSLLQQGKYDTILFCLQEICKIYDIDIYSSSADKGFANIINITLSLEETLTAIATEESKNNDLKKFWTSFITWFEDVPEEDKVIKPTFYYWEGSSHAGYNKMFIDYNKFYKIQYGVPYENILLNVCFDNIKNFIEMIYKFILIPTDGRLKFTIKVNEILRNFALPYKLDKGKFTSYSYKTSESIDNIFNFEQFERKIRYSEEMIIHKDIMDKHTALNYISDSFSYFFSLFKKTETESFTDEKVYIILSKSICNDTSKKIYSLIKEEISCVKRIINNDYDIRHNEFYSTKDNTNRESLTDIKSIEYLYNRIYALLFLLRINYRQVNKINDAEINDDELPF